VKIDNFYTATIYEKGAEVIRMLSILLGEKDFRAGMDLYFDRWDGHATTVEAFIACFAEASGRNLDDFFVWYQQAGTPTVDIAATYDAAARALELVITQATGPTPGQADKRPLTIPLAFGLLDEEGRPLKSTEVVVLSGAETRLRIEDVASTPVLSALRGFSAPVKLTTDAPDRDAYVLLASDPDLFNRWEAGQNLARALILARADGAPDEVAEERFAEAIGRALSDQSAEAAFKALLLALPSENDLAMAVARADPAAIHDAREALRRRIAVHLSAPLVRLHDGLSEGGTFSPDAEAAGRRALRNATIELLAADPRGRNRDLAREHFRTASNMTDAIGGLVALMLMGGPDFEDALTEFYDRWKYEPLVIDKWFAVQARDPDEGVLGRVLALTTHPAFDAKTPARLRALVQSFASSNPSRFHDPSGDGYRFLADQVIATDAINPMTAARLVEPLCVWPRYKPELGALMRAELARIAANPNLSKNLAELVGKALEN
jgi:aminopeptidase N